MRVPLILSASILLLIPLGCSEPDSGLTKSQVTQMLEIQESTQRESSEVSRQRDDLEADRRKWAQRERQDPILAETIHTVASLLVCCLPLLLVAILMWPTRASPSEEAICDAIISETAPDRARLLDPPEDPRRIE